MSVFSGELSGSLRFWQNDLVQAEVTPGANSLHFTSSIYGTGSTLTYNGIDILAKLAYIEAGYGGPANIGALNIWSASAKIQIANLEARTSSIDSLNASTSSFLTLTAAAGVVSSSTQIEALGFNRHVISASQQILDLGFLTSSDLSNVISSSQQIYNLGFVTSSNIANYSDLANIPGGIISSSFQIEAYGFITASVIPNGTISSSQQIFDLGFRTDVISSSQQILDLGFLTSSDLSNVVSSSQQIQALGFVTSSNIADYNNLYNIPVGIVSSSFQIESLGFITSSGLSPGIVSSSAQIEAFGFSLQAISSSQQILNLGFVTSSGDIITPGTISSSQQILNLGFVTSSNIADYNNLYNIPIGIISSSQQVINLGFITGSPEGTISSSQQILNLGFVSGALTLARLQDTNVAGVQDKEILAYNGTNQLWEAQGLGNLGVITAVNPNGGIVGGGSQGDVTIGVDPGLGIEINQYGVSINTGSYHFIQGVKRYGGIFQPTGSYYSANTDLEVTGSFHLKGLFELTPQTTPTPVQGAVYLGLDNNLYVGV